MEPSQYPGIRFPDRAEALEEFAGYRVFLDPWDPLADELQRFYEALSVRRDSRVLAIHGEQGVGKTLFSNKLQQDFLASKSGEAGQPDEQNLWHRISGGADLDWNLIDSATKGSDLLLVDDSSDWVTSTQTWIAGRTDRRCIVVADNAERAFFRQGLVELSDAEFIQLADDAKLTRMAAQRLVDLCRRQFRGALLVVLSNDERFLLDLHEAMQAQHAGLMSLTNLEVPDAKTKETVVRVNTNRLNNRSYWYCLDKAGPDEKGNVREALRGASSFPDSFAAVDHAIRTATPTRIGRPARKNVITFVVFSGESDARTISPADLGSVHRTECWHEDLTVTVLDQGWAPGDMGRRDASLLESEWVLRLSVIGERLVSDLVRSPGDQDTQEAWKGLLELLETFHGPGTHAPTRAAYKKALEDLLKSWPARRPAVADFWERGQARSALYEHALRTLYPTYDQESKAFLRYRPDLVISPYVPCSIVSAVGSDQEAINAAIRREAHVFEVTAQQSPTVASLQSYLTAKLPNYVDVMQSQ